MRDGLIARAALRSWIFPAALVALGLGFALLPLAQGRIFFYWDNAQQHVAQTAFLQEGLRQSAIPQWWPNVGLGFPATAEGQAAHYHPIRLIVALLFSTPAALMWELAIYFAIAGLSTYFFLREFRLHRAACFLGGASQMFCGFAMVYVRNIALHRSFCLLPLAMLCAERIVRRGDARSWLGAVVVVGVQFLAGHPSLAVVTAVATVAYVALRVLHEQWSRGARLTQIATGLARHVSVWVVAVALGFALAAIQVVPTLLHAKQSQRAGGLSFESAVEVLPATPRGLGQLIFPFAYTQGDFLTPPAPWGPFNPVPTAGMYSGVLCVVLAPVALWWRRRGRDATLPLAVSCVLAIGFALGAQGGLFPLLWSLPGMNGLRFPSRFLLWAAFCVSCLAAFGAHRLIAIGRLRLPSARTFAPLVLVALGVLAFAAALWLRLPETRSGVLISLGWYGAAFGLVVLLTRVTGRVRGLVLVLVACLALGDLWFFRARGGYAPAIPIDSAMAPTGAAAFLQQDHDQFRILSLIATDHGAFVTSDLKDYVQADLSTIWGIDSADVFLSLFLKRHYAVRTSIVQELLARPESAASLASYLAAMNVRYIVAPAELALAGWERVHEGRPTSVWRNPVTLPRAFVVGRVVPQQFPLRDEWRRRSDERLADYKRDVADWTSRAVDAQVLDHVMDRQLDYRTTAEAEGAELLGLNDIAEAAPVEVKDSKPDEMRFSARTSTPALLVISNNWYPGWTATVNGAPAPLIHTNWIMTGLQVPAGSSEVVLRYRTPGFRPGAIVSASVLLLVGLLLAWPPPLRRLLNRG